MTTSLEQKKKKYPLKDIRVFVDAEWCVGNTPVSVQVLMETPEGVSLKFIVINDIFQSQLDSKIIDEWVVKNECKIIYYPLSDSFNVVHSLLKEYYLPTLGLESGSDFYFSGEVYIFYSFQDLGFAFGWENVEEQLKKEMSSKSRYKIEQKRSITGYLKIKDGETCRLNRWGICDLSGLTNTSLKEFASSLGVSMENKGLLDDLKSSMDLALVTRTKTFLDYCLDDVLVLRAIHINFLEFVNEILTETLNLPDYLKFTKRDMPLTSGALVAETFLRYIYYHGQKNSQKLYYNFLKTKDLYKPPEGSLGSNSLFYLAMWSISSFKKDISKREEYLKIYKDVFESQELFSILEKSLEHGKILSNWKYAKPFEDYPFSGASIEVLSKLDSRSTAVLNCLVSGGRANNELPSEYQMSNVLDVDLRSCYGSALSSFSFPIGLPTIIAFGPNEDRITLKEFLNEYESELVPGLYKITCSGKFSFKQDLLFSKVTTYEKMHETIANFNAKFSERDVDSVHFSNDFIIARKECQNAVITSDILEVLKKVASNKEYPEFLNLRVETAIFWKKSDRCYSVEHWVREVLKNPGELIYDEKNQGVVDSRSRRWYPLELKNFIGNLVERRNRIKSESKKVSVKEEKEKLKGLSNIIKLFVNTLYGTMASPFFETSNVVVADNITARARVNVWLMAKALNLRQCITDGGAYTPQTVNFFKKGVVLKKPGFDTLSDIRLLKKHRSIETSSLGNIDWAEVFLSGCIFEFLKDIDNMVYKHINLFWSIYGIQMKLEIEHKLENSAVFGVYTGKANYALKTFNFETQRFDKKIFRLRGARVGEGEYYPIVYILHDNLLEQNDNFVLPSI